jgi:DNA adenine methylase
MTNSQLQLLPTSIKPPIKWVGGKRQFLPKIAQYFEQSGATTLIEPFFGGGSVTLGLRPQRAIANDLNPHLINFWEHCKSRGMGSYPWQFRYENSAQRFEKARKYFNASLLNEKDRKTVVAAMAFYYLLKTCHGGVCRFNQSGEFNTPYGKYPTVNFAYDWETLADALRSVEIHQGDWFEFLTTKVNSFDNAMVFADPPYHQTFDYSSGFDWGDQVILANYLGGLDCPVIATNSWCDDIVDLYVAKGFRPEKVLRTAGHGQAWEMFAVKNF